MADRGEHQVKILLVDKDRDDLAYYQSVFQKQGYRVHATSSYGEAFSCLTSDKFDLVVADQGSSAFEAKGILQKAIEIDRRLPVLVLTRHLDMSCYLEAMQLGAVDYLEEPLKPDEMIRAVKGHLNSPSRERPKVGMETRGEV
jgi:DNA-binding NtrC family response regulator